MMAKKQSFKLWGGGRAYASTKAREWPDFVGPKGRRSFKKLAHRLFRRTERDCVRKSWKSKELLPLFCTSCGSQLTRTDIYYDNCGVCGVAPMPREIKTN